MGWSIVNHSLFRTLFLVGRLLWKSLSFQDMVSFWWEDCCGNRLGRCWEERFPVYIVSTTFLKVLTCTISTTFLKVLKCTISMANHKHHDKVPHVQKILRHQSRLRTAPLQLRKRVRHMPGKETSDDGPALWTSILPGRPSKNWHTAHRGAGSQQQTHRQQQAQQATPEESP